MLLADHQYSATNRELLAAYRSVRHFMQFTDHKPLVAMMKILDTWSATQAQYLATIS